MARKIYEDGFLHINEPISADLLSDQLRLPIRSIRYGINLLVQAGLVKKFQNLRDMRTTLYAVTKPTGQAQPLSIEA